jgi:anti-anti-sigma regulatory factor
VDVSVSDVSQRVIEDVAERVAGGLTCVIVDMSGVELFDAAGVGLLLRLQSVTQYATAGFAVRHPS